MENKLKKIDSLTKLDYNAYQKLLKTSWEELAAAPEPLGFALIAGDHLPWKNAKANELPEQPLLYIGSISKWKMEINGHDKLIPKDFSYGECKVVEVGTGVHVYLVPQKGKATDDKQLKPIKKILKKFKPKVFLEVVADLSTVEQEEKPDTNTEDSNKNLQKMSLELRQYHAKTQKIKENIKGATPEAKNQLQIQYQQILRRLKHVVADWKEEIAPNAAELLTSKPDQNAHKIYQHWQTFFEKRQAAKEGKGDQEGIVAEEERIYSKLAGDLEQFYANIEKGELLEVDLIENNINNLKRHYGRWQQFVQGKKSAFAEELEAAGKIIQDINQQWPTIKPLLERSAQLRQAMEQAMQQNDLIKTIDLSKELQQIEEQLQKTT